MPAKHTRKHERQWRGFDPRRNPTANFKPIVSIYDLRFSAYDWKLGPGLLGPLFLRSERRVYQIQQGVHLGLGRVDTVSLPASGEMQLRSKEVPLNEFWNGKRKLLDWKHDKTNRAFFH